MELSRRRSISGRGRPMNRLAIRRLSGTQTPMNWSPSPYSPTPVLEKRRNCGISLAFARAARAVWTLTLVIWSERRTNFLLKFLFLVLVLGGRKKDFPIRSIASISVGQMSRPVRKPSCEWVMNQSAGLSYHWNNCKYSLVTSCTSTIASREILCYGPSGEDLVFFLISFLSLISDASVLSFVSLLLLKPKHIIDMSVVDSPYLRGILIPLEDRLSNDDRRRLHFFLADDILRRIRDDPTLSGTLSLLESLFDQDKINGEDFTFLIDALDAIQCRDAANILRGFLRPSPFSSTCLVLLRRLSQWFMRSWSEWVDSESWLNWVRTWSRMFSFLFLGVTAMADKQAMCSSMSKPFSIFSLGERVSHLVLMLFVFLVGLLYLFIRGLCSRSMEERR